MVVAGISVETSKIQQAGRLEKYWESWADSTWKKITACDGEKWFQEGLAVQCRSSPRLQGCFFPGRGHRIKGSLSCCLSLWCRLEGYATEAFLKWKSLVWVSQSPADVTSQVRCVTFVCPQSLQSCPTLCNCLSPWGFPSKNSRVNCHALLQRIFPI